jgi:hypothetical protein
MLIGNFARTCVSGIFFLSLLSFQSLAEDFYCLPLTDLPLVEGEIPKTKIEKETGPQRIPWQKRMLLRAHMQPYAVGDENTEVYVDISGERWRPSNSVGENVTGTRIALKVAEGKAASGKLYIPRNDWSGMQKLEFEIKAGRKAQSEAKRLFYQTKEQHYRRLLELRVPGSAWFRHQMLSARLARRGKTLKADSPIDIAAERDDRPRAGDIQRTYNLFTGGRAVSENLQLDRVLQVDPEEDESSVPVGDIQGITTAEIDWKAAIEGMEPDKDPIASTIPMDQHAVFFPSFKALVETMTEAGKRGVPVLHLLEPRAEDARTRERYEKQLCLPADELSKRLASGLVRSVAITGSDPYLRTGSDVAVIFESPTPEVLARLVAQRQEAFATGEIDKTRGKAGGIKYTGVVSRWRGISSYVATRGNFVIVANSAAQMELILRTGQKDLTPLADAPEFTYFRNRYPLNAEETAFLVLTDAAIRRWCSPKWRIGASRRSRAAAAMMELQARYLDELDKGVKTTREITLQEPVPGLGKLFLTPNGIASENYGTLTFLTPIRELSIETATEVEAEAYQLFRRGYQRNWRAYFDPIAVRFSMDEAMLTADMTVRPLISGSDYRPVMAVTGNAAVEPGEGDLHEESMLHFIMSLDKEAEEVRGIASFASQMAPGLRVGLLDWIGNWIAIYVDRDPMWKKLDELTDKKGFDAAEDFMERNVWQVPAALTVDVANGFKLTGFLAAVRGYINETAPGMTAWETREYKDSSYVRVSPSAQARSAMPEADGQQDMAIYYAVSGEMLMLSPNEDVIKRGLERWAARRKEQKEDAPGTNPEHPWLGKSIAAQVEGGALSVLQNLYRDSLARAYRRRSWANLMILNEWRRRYGEKNPVKFHLDKWGVRLVCPGGGSYVWDSTYQTMASTVYGHPGEPDSAKDLPDPLRQFSGAHFGITFEDDGLRARARVFRK